jgi:hypothetical protein
MEPNNYASLDPLGPDALLEKGTEFQREIDGLEAELDDLKAETKDKKENLARFQKKVAAIFHARESGADLWLLNGGELTDERPDTEGSLPLRLIPDEVEEPEGSLPLTDEDTASDEPEGGRAAAENDAPGYPEEQAGQVYQGKSSAGNTCTVKEPSPGSGKWTGRVSGKPIAIEQPLVIAFRLVEEFTGDTGPDGIDWKPTLEIQTVDEEDVDAELDMVDL